MTDPRTEHRRSGHNTDVPQTWYRDSVGHGTNNTGHLKETAKKFLKICRICISCL